VPSRAEIYLNGALESATPAPAAPAAPASEPQ
jgi:pilus assembly protein CpaC